LVPLVEGLLLDDSLDVLSNALKDVFTFVPTEVFVVVAVVGTNVNTSFNALLNTSRLSSSNSPSTNGTKTTGMDSSRENPSDDFDFSTRVSPQTATPNGCNVNLSRSSSHRHTPFDTQNVNFSATGINSQQHRV
jgi:hypothetical protein